MAGKNPPGGGNGLLQGAEHLRHILRERTVGADGSVGLVEGGVAFLRDLRGGRGLGDGDRRGLLRRRAR